MPRLFTALELPVTVVSQMALARGGVVGARWLEPEDYHITLRFIGDIDARAARDIAETLGRDPTAEAHVRFDGSAGSAATSRARSSPGQGGPGAHGVAGRSGAAVETHRR